MKRLICLPLFWSHGGLKKSLYTTQGKDGFFRHVTSFPSGMFARFRTAVAGLLVDLKHVSLQSMPATVPVFVPGPDFCGLPYMTSDSISLRLLAGRHFLESYFSKEHTVTLINHIRSIEKLANDVVHHVDRKEYPDAHVCLDDIEKKVRLAHRHIDHLQNVTDFCARPEGG